MTITEPRTFYYADEVEELIVKERDKFKADIEQARKDERQKCIDFIKSYPKFFNRARVSKALETLTLPED